MLEELTIKNYALIDDLTIPFQEGLNVLTGETGAGKSILVGALGLLLGAKGDPDAIRAGKDEITVSGIIRPENIPEVTEWLAEKSIQLEEGILIIRRTVKRSGRGSIYVQSVPVLLGDLKELASFLFDMHSQHEHQSLFSIENHRKLLDRYAGHEKETTQFSKLFKELSQVVSDLNALSGEKADKEKEIELLEKSIAEIEKADPTSEEEATLTERLKILSKGEEISSSVEKTKKLLSESNRGALAGMREASGLIKKTAAIDPSLEPLISQFDNAFLEVEDVFLSVQTYYNKLNFSLDELKECEERLAEIHQLEKRYGIDIETVLKHKTDCEKRLESFKHSDSALENLVKRKETLHKELFQKADELSQKRKEATVSLNEKIKTAMESLGMGGADFDVSITQRKDENGKPLCSRYGYDRVEFLLSANRGEPLKPLKNVASGGEIARIMLALKSVLAAADTVSTLVFDEIDTGIGGNVAISIGKYLKKISTYKQLFSITHLATIAVFADNHIKVAKQDIDNRTETIIFPVEGEARTEEIARMLAGDSGREVALKHAKELLDQYSGSKS